MFLGVTDVIKRVENILDHPVITVEGERTLEHDRRPVHDTGLQSVTLLIPEIDITGDEIATALGHFPPARLCTSMILTGVTGGHMVDDRSFGRWLFNPPEQVHEHALSCPAPADDTHNLPFRDLERHLVKTRVSSKSMQRSFTLMNGFGIVSSYSEIIHQGSLPLDRKIGRIFLALACPFSAFFAGPQSPPDYPSPFQRSGSVKVRHGKSS